MNEWSINSRGYLEDKNNRLQHRVYYEAKHGSIPKDWIIHHIDFVKTNNELSNLIALPEKFHSRLHDVMRKKNTKYPRKYIQALLDIYVKYTPNEGEPKKISKQKRNKTLRYLQQIAFRENARESQKAGTAKTWLKKKNETIQKTDQKGAESAG